VIAEDALAASRRAGVAATPASISECNPAIPGRFFVFGQCCDHAGAIHSLTARLIPRSATSQRRTRAECGALAGVRSAARPDPDSDQAGPQARVDGDMHCYPVADPDSEPVAVAQPLPEQAGCQQGDVARRRPPR
jgi:hypothetical protein